MSEIATPPGGPRQQALNRATAMATAAEYRQWAEECFKWARNASDEDVRQSYLKIGQLWLEHAARTEGVAGTITPQEPRTTNK